jgi:energy-coupling factor transport system ATP-binding protein
VLVLDEPTSALDPTAAEEVLAAVTRLVHDLGVTVLVAEHRLERVVQYADRVLHVRPDGSVFAGPPQQVLSTSPVVPPVVELARLAGWTPLPLSVRDARRHAPALRERLLPAPRRVPVAPGATLLRARGLAVRYGHVTAVRDADLDLRAGEVVALMGRNGSGKSSLLWALQGSGPRDSGTVDVTAWANPAVADTRRLDPHRLDPRGLNPDEARALVGLVPQTPGDLLYLDSVRAELAQADHESAAAPGTANALLQRISPGIDADRHPRDLSEGQRLALVLAVQLTAGPRVVLLDEPTRGLDYGAKRRLVEVLRELAAGGRVVVVSTHDVEFVALAADRVVVMAQGDVVSDGPTAEIVVSSPTFAPQVAKVLAPHHFLTVDEVRVAMTRDAVGEPA